MPYDLTRFDLETANRCSDGLRTAVTGSATLEMSARAVAKHLHEELADTGGTPASVLVRCYKTHPFMDLPDELQRVARRALGAVAFSPPDPAMKCLVLLATAGEEASWNDRRNSRGHQAIPLPSPHVVERAPMIAQLIQDLGFDVAQVVRGHNSAVHAGGADTFGIFHVEEAVGSPYIPAQQEFVIPYRVKSVLGFGGSLTTGEIFATIIFSRASIPVGSGERFRAIAASLVNSLAPLTTATFDANPH